MATPADQSLNLILLKRITCPACLDPMENIIYLCSLGHSVCANCKKYITSCPVCRSKMTTNRNYGMEAITEDLFYPCRFINCKLYLGKSHIDKHLKVCPHRMYNCLLSTDGPACQWTGPSYNLSEHAHQKHENRSWMQEENLDRWREGTGDEVQLIRAYQRVFYLHRICEGNTGSSNLVHWVIQLIGAKEAGVTYEFLLHIYCENSTREIKFTEIVYDDNCPVTDLISKGNCVSVPVKNLMTFNNKYNSVWYKLKIKKCVQA